MRAETLAVKDASSAALRVLYSVPAGDVVMVMGEPRPWDQMVTVIWNQRSVVMFAIDVVERGEEILGAAA